MAARPALADHSGKGLFLTQGGSIAAPESTTLWSFQPRDPAKAPFQLVFESHQFNSTWDTVMYLGYNTAGSGRVVASEPSFRFVVEQDYEVAPGEHWLEAYVEWIPGSGASAPAAGRPVFWRFDRATGTIVGFDIKSKGVDFTHWDNDANVFARIYPGGMNLGGTANASAITLALRPAAGFGSAFNMAHGGATALAISTTSASNVPIAINGQGTLWLFDRRVGLGIEDNSASLTARDAFGGDVFIAREAPGGQTGQFFAARDSAGTGTHWRVGPQGHMFVARTDPPPDAEIRPGECGFWFDPTSAPPKLMLKAKEADGTVRTAEVPLV